MISTTDSWLEDGHANQECSRPQSHSWGSSLFSVPSCSWGRDVGVKVRRSSEFVCKSLGASPCCHLKRKSPPQARDGMYGACWILLKSLKCACPSVISFLLLQGSCRKRLKLRSLLGSDAKEQSERKSYNRKMIKQFRF